eukprot:1361565-Amorphochlora_amoeboformis.AAC.1
MAKFLFQDIPMWETNTLTWSLDGRTVEWHRSDKEFCKEGAVLPFTKHLVHKHLVHSTRVSISTNQTAGLQPRKRRMTPSRRLNISTSLVVDNHNIGQQETLGDASTTIAAFARTSTLGPAREGRRVQRKFFPTPRSLGWSCLQNGTGHVRLLFYLRHPPWSQNWNHDRTGVHDDGQGVSFVCWSGTNTQQSWCYGKLIYIGNTMFVHKLCAKFLPKTSEAFFDDEVDSYFFSGSMPEWLKKTIHDEIRRCRKLRYVVGCFMDGCEH